MERERRGACRTRREESVCALGRTRADAGGASRHMGPCARWSVTDGGCCCGGGRLARWLHPPGQAGAPGLEEYGAATDACPCSGCRRAAKRNRLSRHLLFLFCPGMRCHSMRWEGSYLELRRGLLGAASVFRFPRHSGIRLALWRFCSDLEGVCESRTRRTSTWRM